MKNNLNMQPPTRNLARPRPGPLRAHPKNVAAEVTRLLSTPSRIVFPKMNRITQAFPVSVPRLRGQEAKTASNYKPAIAIPHQAKNQVKNAHFPSGTDRHRVQYLRVTVRLGQRGKPGKTRFPQFINPLHVTILHCVPSHHPMEAATQWQKCPKSN
jgi:hypothetical protein